MISQFVWKARLFLLTALPVSDSYKPSADAQVTSDALTLIAASAASVACVASSPSPAYPHSC